MNVKKTKKFKENRPENYHVHDRDWISLAFGRHPTVGRTGSGPYPRVDEVSEGLELVGDFLLSLL